MKYICQIIRGKVTKVEQRESPFPVNVVGYASATMLFKDEGYVVSVEASNDNEAKVKALENFQISAVAFGRDFEEFDLNESVEWICKTLNATRTVDGFVKGNIYFTVQGRQLKAKAITIKHGMGWETAKEITNKKTINSEAEVWEFVLNTIKENGEK